MRGQGLQRLLESPRLLRAELECDGGWWISCDLAKATERAELDPSGEEPGARARGVDGKALGATGGDKRNVSNMTMSGILAAADDNNSSERKQGMKRWTGSINTLTVGEFEDVALLATREKLPHLDPSAFHVGFNLVRAASRLVQASEEAIHRRLGWSWAGFGIMYIVWIAGEIEARDISRLAGVTRQTTSSVLKTLEKDGLVERTRDSHADRRLVTVRLTPKAAEAIAHAMTDQNALEAQFLASMTEGERLVLGDLLRRLLGHVDDARRAINGAPG